MLFASGFSWFALFRQLSDGALLEAVGLHAPESASATYAVVTAWFVCLLVIGFAILARIGLERTIAKQGLERYFADTRISPRTISEVFGTGWLNLMSDILGPKEARFFFPFVATLFIYILSNNLLGLFPGFLPATSYVDANVGMALLVFLVFNLTGLLKDPISYLKHLWGPIWWFGWFIMVIEVIGLIFRPITLTVRLTANIIADHAMFSAMSGLVPWVLPVGLLVFALFVSVVQAFVFALLTTIYISLALPHHDVHEVHHA